MLSVNSMNIAFDAKRLYNNFTGLGNYSRTTIDILTENHPENAYFLFTPKIADRRSNERGITSKYLTLDHCDTILPQGLVKGSLWRTFQVTDEAKKIHADIFHGLSNELPYGLRKKGIASVVTIHDVAFHTFPYMYHWHDRKIYDMKWRYAIQNADRIIAISECTKNDIIKYYDVDENKIDIIYQPVSRRFYSTMTDDEATKILSDTELCTIKDFILYVGTINSRKNLLGIVKALKLLPDSIKLPLIVVGNGREYKEEVKKYIRQHDMERMVIFPKEKIDDNTLQALYTKARVFVYPSFYEGFGLPVVEALLSKCPVVTSNRSSLPEAGGKDSLQVDPDSIEDIADKMERAITDDELREKMINKGMEYAIKNFHPANVANSLINTYNKAL